MLAMPQTCQRRRESPSNVALAAKSTAIHAALVMRLHIRPLYDQSESRLAILPLLQASDFILLLA